MFRKAASEAEVAFGENDDCTIDFLIAIRVFYQEQDRWQDAGSISNKRSQLQWPRMVRKVSLPQDLKWRWRVSATSCMFLPVTSLRMGCGSAGRENEKKMFARSDSLFKTENLSVQIARDLLGFLC
jgi:hypothetical protein